MQKLCSQFPTIGSFSGMKVCPGDDDDGIFEAFTKTLLSRFFREAFSSLPSRPTTTTSYSSSKLVTVLLQFQLYLQFFIFGAKPLKVFKKCSENFPNYKFIQLIKKAHKKSGLKFTCDQDTLMVSEFPLDPTIFPQSREKL